jgi:hypothetical protein
MVFGTMETKNEYGRVVTWLLRDAVVSNQPHGGTQISHALINLLQSSIFSLLGLG